MSEINRKRHAMRATSVQTLGKLPAAVLFRAGDGDLSDFRANAHAGSSRS
jgi:hypothetical protein